MSDGNVKGESKIVQVPVMQISVNRYQPRKSFKREELRQLAKSIEHNGILQPLTVRRINNFEYELISGERRLRAAVLAGLSSVPCIVIYCSGKQSAVYSIVENVQRAELNYFEQAEAMRMLIKDFSFTKETVAQQLGKRESTVSDKLKLLNYSREERDLILENSLPERSALCLLKIENERARKKVLKKVIENSLNVAQIEDVVERLLSPNKDKKELKHQTIIIKDIRLFYNTINKAVKTMQSSGINATEEKTETDEFIEYKIRITK